MTSSRKDFGSYVARPHSASNVHSETGAERFTPGPWSTTGERLSTIDRRTYEIARVRESGYVDGISIVAGARLPDPFPLTQGIHNAHLIAAAPDMRAALGECLCALMFEAERAAREQDEVALRQITKAVTMARAALLKARGDTLSSEHVAHSNDQAT